MGKKLLKKFYKCINFILLISIIVIINSCGKLTNDLDGYFRYWTTRPKKAETTIQKKNEGIDDSDTYCIKLDNPKTVIKYFIKNTEGFVLKDKDVLIFPNLQREEGKAFLKKLNKEQPKAGTDYTLKFVKNSDKKDISYFELILTKSYFEIFKQGAFILNPTIHMLPADKKDGREFGYYAQKFKINTKPPAIKDAVFMFDDQTASPGGKKEYILCFNMPDCSGTHSDVKTVLINDKSYKLDLSTTPYGISGANISNAVGIMNLKAIESGKNFTAGTNPVYFHTGKYDGSPKKEYIVTLKDNSGLSSTKVSRETGKAKLAPPKAYDKDGVELTGTINLSVENKAKITFKAEDYIDGTSAGSGVQITYTVTPTGGTAETKTVSAPATIELPGSVSGKTYTIKSTAKKTAVVDSEESSWTVNVKTVPVAEVPDPSNSTEDAWTQLKNAVEDPNGPGIIRINGEIKAINDTGNESTEITVKRKVRIEAQSGMATINANNHATDTNKQRTIFHIVNGSNGDLTIANLTLIGGHKTKLGISSDTHPFTVSNCHIKDFNVGIHQSGSTSEINGTTFDNCKRGSEVRYSGTQTIKDSSIQNCTGKAISVSYPGSTIKIYNTIIKNNGTAMASDEKGKGGYIGGGGSGTMELHVAGTTKFENNDVYLVKNCTSIIVIDEALTESNVATLSFDNNDYTVGREVIKLASPAPSGVVLADQVGKFKVKNAPDGSEWVIDNAGKLQKAPIRTWAGLKAAVQDTSSTAPATITLTQDITATATDYGQITVPNGRTVTIQSDTAGTARAINANCTATNQNHRIFKIESGGNLTIEDITLKGGNTGSHFGGAVYVFGSFSMNSGSTIRDNTSAERGGGVYVANGGTLTMESGSTIRDNNSTESGGGVYVANGGTFVMNGGTIAGNAIPSNGLGTGVYVFLGTFKMQGDAKVGGGSQNNTVYLKNGKTIEITGALTGTSATNPAATIEPETYPNSSTPTVTVLSGSSMASEYSKFKVKDQSAGGNTVKWHINSDGVLRKEGTIYGSDPNAWEKLLQAVENASNGDTINISGEIKATNDANNNGEIVINNKNITIHGTDPANDKINANCWTGTGAPSPSENPPDSPHRVFKIEGSSKVTVENLVITGGKETEGGGIYIPGSNPGPELTLKNCDVQNNAATEKGGGIYLGEASNGAMKSKLIMEGSHVMGNKISSTGGGTFMGGGICVMNGGTVEINGTESVIEGNSIEVSPASSVAKGCGLYLHNDSVECTITDGSIKDNYGVAENVWGKGVYMFVYTDNTFGTLKMKGAVKVGGGSKNNDICLGNSSNTYAQITPVGVLSADPVATITPENYPTGGSTVQVLNGSDITSGTAPNENYTRFKVADDASGGKWEVDNTGKLKLGTVTIDGTSSSAWAELKAAVEGTGAYVANPPAEITIKNTITAPSGASRLYVIRKLTVKGSTATATDSVIDAANHCHIFEVRNNSGTGDLTLENLTLRNGQVSTSGGGGVFAKGCNLTMTNVRVETCTASAGAGIFWKDGNSNVNLHMTDCVITGNTVVTSGDGGGMYVWIQASTDSWLKDCTIEGNHNNTTASSFGGGGLYVRRTAGSCTNSLKLTSCTIRDNDVPATGGKGGGIYVNAAGTSEALYLLNRLSTQTTITGNTGDKGKGIYIEGAGQVALGSYFTIDADNDIYLAGTDTNQINLKPASLAIKSSGGTNIPWRITLADYSPRDIMAGYVNLNSNNTKFQVVPKIESGKKTYYRIAQMGNLVEQTEFHVKSTGDDGGYGTNDISNKSPFATLQHAIDSCRTAGKEYEIWILDDLSGNAARGNVNEARKITIAGYSGGATTLDASGTGNNVLTIGQVGAEVSLKYLTIKGGIAPSGYSSGSGILLSAGTLTLIDDYLTVDMSNDIYVDNSSGSNAVLKAKSLSSYYAHTIGVITPKVYGPSEQILAAGSSGLANAPKVFEITPQVTSFTHFWVLDTNGRLRKPTEFFVDGTSSAAESHQFGTRAHPFANLSNTRATEALVDVPNATVKLLTNSLGTLDLQNKQLSFTSDGTTTRTLTGYVSTNAVMILNTPATGKETRIKLENITITGHSGMDNAEQSGIVVKQGAKLTLSGPNATVDTKHDIYMDMSDATSLAKLTVEGSAPTGTAARITLSNYHEGDQVLSGSTGDIANWASHFTLTNSAWEIGNDGRLKRAPINTWARLKAAVEDTGGPSTITLGQNITATAASNGKISVNRTVTITGGSSVRTINANCGTGSGQTGKKHSIFQIGNSGNLTIEDITLTGGNVSGGLGGGAVLVYGHFTMNDGSTISGCKGSSNKGGGVCIVGGGAFTMNSGSTISGCNVTSGIGGGVCVSSGTFTMNDGSTISGNSAENGGGGIFIGKSGTCTMSGGSIENSTYGGGVRVYKGTFSMEGGSIKNNQGGGVFVKENATFKMSGDARVGAYNSGGGLTDGNTVYLYNNQSLTVVEGGLSYANATTPAAVIEPETYSASTVVLKGVTSTGGALSDLSSFTGKFKVKPEGAQTWSINNSGYLKTP